jgi:hypothetical protein
MLTSTSYPDEIWPLVNLINQSLSSSAGGDAFTSDILRRELVSAAERLVLAARSPEENIFAIAQQVTIPISHKLHGINTRSAASSKRRSSMCNRAWNSFRATLGWKPSQH